MFSREGCFGRPMGTNYLAEPQFGSRRLGSLSSTFGVRTGDSARARIAGRHRGLCVRPER
jgi:hypothetical protein